ncbi:MAG: hypothetical protein JSW73_01220 [Candidatus Woesearchaeota archaeon]|nr:MAG: hypothetical protein JSW73_01220 [Candidatus Woesearchaeota archaeon]
MYRRANFSVFILVSIFIFILLLPSFFILLKFDGFTLYQRFQEYEPWISITGVTVAEDVMIIKKNFEEPFLFPITLENQEFMVVELTNCISVGEVGEPSLPVCPVHILISQSKVISNVDVDYFDETRIDYDLSNKPIVPAQKEIPISCEDVPDFALNQEIYNSDQPVPELIYENKGTGLMVGFNILTINLNPVRYIPKNGELYYYPKMEISVTLADGFGAVSEQENKFLRLKESDVDRVSSLIENPSTISSYSVPVEFGTLDAPLNGSCTCDPTKTYEYVIITDESLLNSSGYNYSWYDLINHRRNYSGLNGTIVTVQQIENCSDYQNNTYPFNDSAHSIREFIKDAYQNWGTEYVVLGGKWRDDTPAEKMVQYRLFTDIYETGTYDTMPCDLYYSNLDGDWWYSNYSVWGGGKNSPVNDKFSEIYVGRITAYDTEHVSNAVRKIIWYDINNHSEEWLVTVTFAGANLGWAVTSKQYMEELRIGNGSYSENIGFEEWNSKHSYYPFYTLENRYYHADDTWSDFLESIENDTSSIVNHIGHSSWNTPFSLTNWQFRNNTLPFFGYSQGCLAGRFSSGFSGCEQTMCRHPEKHAFAVVLNTGYGYGSFSSTHGASQQLHKIFWAYFFNEAENNLSEWELGRAQSYSKDEFSAYIDSNHAKCYVWYSSHLFGDPAQKLEIASVIKSNGESCSYEYECLSGYCEDRVCCSSSCGVCQACNINGSKGNCSNYTQGSDPDNECSTAECGIGYCNGFGTCEVYSDGLRHNCSSCYYCTDLDESCDLVPDGQDPNNNCAGGNGTSNGCAGDYCDGSGSCQIISSGEGNCPICTLCLDNDTECEYYSNNTQDNVGNLTCFGICKKCDGLGQCINQTAGEDIFDQCDANLECHIGICNGLGECDVYSNGEKGSCGPCKYCNDSDSNCEYVPSGQDLFSECVGLQCDGDAITPYYWGWDSLTCYYSSNIFSRDHYCDGSGSCYAAEDLCPSQGKDGSTNITCNCAEALTGCNGTVVGSCLNCAPLNNSAPTAPILLYPADETNNTNNSVDFDWDDSIDIDGDNISYYLAINSSVNSTQITYSVMESSYSSYSTIDNVTYYWRVKASDGLDNSSWSSTYKFIEIIEVEEEPEEEEDQTPSGGSGSSGGGGGGSPSPILSSASTITPPSINYDLSETNEEEIKEVVKSKLSEISSNTKEVYKDVSVDVSVNHPSSESTSLDFSFKYGKGTPLKKVMIFIEVPKSFAESAEDITFESSVPYSKMEVVENDPVYYFYYENLESENISYSFHNNEYSIGSKVIEDVSQPWVFFETEEEVVPECGNNVIEKGEECDSVSGLIEGYRCSAECKLVPILQCIDDGDCTQEETELGECNDCLISTPAPTSAYVILYQKWFVVLLIIFIICTLILGLKLEIKNKKKRKK